MLPMTAMRHRLTKSFHREDPSPPEHLGTSSPEDRLDWMTALLDGNRMRVHLGGRDRTGMILHLSRLVFEHGLSIQESSVTRLQDQSGSIFLITGPPEQLRKLSERLEGESDRVLEGEVISPYKVFDLTINVPDRNGLILDVCTILKEYKVNIKSQTSFVYPDLDDLWWAHIHTRVEVTRERISDMQRMERELDEMCRKAYEDQSSGTPDHLDLSGWLVALRERQGGGTDSP